MPFEYVETVHKVAPSGAAGVSVTALASWGASPAWVEIAPSTAAAWLLTGFSAQPGGSVSDFHEWELEVGVGGAGSEVVVATFRGSNVSSVTECPGVVLLPILLDNIASGVRVAVRIRKSTATNRTWVVKLGYYEKPITGSLTTTAKPLKSYPPSANGASITPNATPWANSAWAELIASTAAALVVAHLNVRMLNSLVSLEYEVDLGIGTAGAEVVIETLRGGIDSSGGGNGFPYLLRAWPVLDAIPTSTRVAVRLRKSDTDVTAFVVGMNAWEKPL